MKTKNIKRVIFNSFKVYPFIVFLYCLVYTIVASNQYNHSVSSSPIISPDFAFRQYSGGFLDDVGNSDFVLLCENLPFDSELISLVDYLTNNINDYSAFYPSIYIVVHCIVWFIWISLIELFVNAVMFLPMYANKWLEGKL